MLIAADELTERFDRDGYLVLKKVLEPRLVNELRAECLKIVEEEAQRLLQAGKISDPLTNEPFETRLFKLHEGDTEAAPTRYRENLHRPAFYRLFFHEQLLDMVETLHGSELRLYPNYTLRPKFPEWGGHQVLWHQDGGYTAGGAGGSDVGRLRMVNVWTPLVPVNVENGCMQFIPGTHKLGVMPHVMKKYYLELEPDVLNPRVEKAVDLAVDPGDVILSHNLLFHQGLPNHARTIRWSVDWRYQDATQETLRATRGHLARSIREPELVVSSEQDWCARRFQ